MFHEINVPSRTIASPIDLDSPAIPFCAASAISQRRQEFVIGGFAPRTGSTREIGRLLLGVYDDADRLHYAGSVGTGWDSMLAAAIMRQMQKLETEAMPFNSEFPPKKGRWSKRAVGGERWVRRTAVREVSFAEWTPDGHVRHPSFKGMRKDSRRRA